MPSLERFFNPQTRPFDLNIRSLPGARLYFFSAGTTTPKVTYQDKQGSVESTNPVIADSSGIFPQIFLDGLYRVELRSSANIVQPGWPIDNVGQDSVIVPFAPWSEIVTYQQLEVVSDPLTGDWYRSLIDDNIGNVPADNPSAWEALVSPAASNFISDADWATFSSEPGKISLDVDAELLANMVSDNLTTTTKSANGDFVAGTVTFSRIGRVVTISATGLSKLISINGLFAAGFIPVEYRPGSLVVGGAIISADDPDPLRISYLKAGSTGSLSFVTTAADGTNQANTGYASQISMTYTIDA